MDQVIIGVSYPTVRRALMLDGGMRNEIHDKKTLMQETMEFTTVVMMTGFTLSMS